MFDYVTLEKQAAAALGIQNTPYVYPPPTLWGLTQLTYWRSRAQPWRRERSLSSCCAWKIAHTLKLSPKKNSPKPRRIFFNFFLFFQLSPEQNLLHLRETILFNCRITKRKRKETFIFFASIPWYLSSYTLRDLSNYNQPDESLRHLRRETVSSLFRHYIRQVQVTICRITAR